MELRLYARFWSYIDPVITIFQLVLLGIPIVLAALIKSPMLIAQPGELWTILFAPGMTKILENADIKWKDVKGDIIAQASGIVLELGAGAGHTLKYYDSSKIKHIYGLEPYTPLHPELRKAITASDLTNKYTIINNELTDIEGLEQRGLGPGTIDTIICIQVLCSMPDAEFELVKFQEMLKPGGKLLVFEHVASSDSVTSAIQHFWTPAWSRAVLGCHMNRPIERWLKDLGGWKESQVSGQIRDGPEALFPRVKGVYVKA